MENKNEKSMTLEEMIGEMLKDAKVVKVPLPAKVEEKTEAQKQDKPMPARPSGVPFLSLNIRSWMQRQTTRQRTSTSMSCWSASTRKPVCARRSFWQF